MAEQIRVVVVDDSELVRRGLALVLSRQDNIEVVGEAADGYTAIDLVRRLEPDLVLMDVRMHGIDGIATTQHIKSEIPDAKVLMLSGHDTDEEVLASFAAGADGYCVKGIAPNQLANAIQAVFDGVGWIDPSLARTVFNFVAQAHIQAMEHLAKGSDDHLLSLHELDILAHLAKGYTNQEIAQTLELSNDSVKTSVRRLLQKLEVSDRTQAAVKAIRGGLIC